MYSILCYRPCYSGKSRYIVKVNTLSEVAAFILLKHKTIEHVKDLTRKESIILWRKCYALEQARYNKLHSSQQFSETLQTPEFYAHELCLNSIYRIARNSKRDK